MKSFLRIIPLLSLLLTTIGQASIDRVEPSNWWIGMKDPVFQVLLHGGNISRSTPEIVGPQVSLERIVTLESPNYLFLYLKVSESASPGSIEIRLNYGDETPSDVVNYPLRVRAPGASEIKGFDSSDVMYLLMPDRFANGDSSNDSVEGMLETGVDRSDPYGRHGGDLAGVIEHLDYFQQLGVTALWLNPVLENDMESSSYHGYAITDFFKVDPRFGTLEDYKTLAKEAQARGLKLIMDMIFNHCGSEHWWMKDLPTANWINYSENYKVTNHRRTTHQDPYASLTDTELMTKGWFVPTMPDLNLQQPQLADYMIQNSIWWIETLGLGGIRMDTYPYPDKHAMSEWCARVMREYPHFNITGEEWSLNPLILAYWQEGKVNADGYEGHLPSLIDFPLQNAIKEAFQEEEDWGSGLIKVYETLGADFNYPAPNNFVTFLSNHDTPRYFMEVGSDEDAYRNAFAFLITTRGIPQLLYGDEILMTHYESNGHGDIRKDLPGGWQGDSANVFTEYNISARQARNLDYTRKLLNWRKNKSVVHNGKLLHFGPEDRCYVYFRTNEEEAVMVVLNKNDTYYSLSLDRFAEVLAAYTSGFDIVGDETLSLDGSLMLAPNQPAIIELSK